MILPRSEQERKAFLAGYTSAMIDIGEHGWDVARSFLEIATSVERQEPPRDEGMGTERRFDNL